jgi:hypothetical protein
MASSVMLRSVALVIIDVSKERIAFILSVFLRSVFQLLVTAIVAPSSLIPFALMMEAILSSEISALTRTTRIHCWI